MKKKWIRNIFLLFLTVFFLYFFFKSVDWKEVSSYLININIIFFVLIIVTVPVQYIVRVIRWQYLLKQEKEKVSFYNRFAAISVGFAVSQFIPGRLGELVRPLYLAQKEEMKKGFVLGTIVVERIFDIFSMCFLLGLFLIVKPFNFASVEAEKDIYSNLSYWGIGGFVFALFILIFSLCLYFFKDKTLYLFSYIFKLFPEKYSKKILALMDDFIKGLKFFHSWSNFLIYVILSLLGWLWIIFYYWLFFLAFNISVPYFFLFPYVFLLMIGAAIPTPGMIGGYDVASKFGLTTFFKIDVNLAIGMTIVVHAVQVAVICLIGYIVLWKEGLSLFKLKKYRDIADDIHK